MNEFGIARLGYLCVTIRLDGVARAKINEANKL